MSWTNLKATISAVIKGNDNQEITGPLLKGVLDAIVNNLGANAQFAGIATPETRFVISDGPIFWMTAEAGTYNLNGETVIVENATLAIFIWDCSTWSATLVPISGVATVDEMNTAIASALTSYYTKSEVNAALGDKVDKVAGKGLSTNDYTDAEKEKLAELENYDDTQVRQLINEEKTTRQQGDNALSESITQEETRAKGAEQTLQLAIDIINGKIPAQATAQNQLADKSFVNSSISTATADFKGTYNSLQELEQVTANANDYAFVIATDAAGNTVYKRYKWVDGTGWRWEYDLNNSSFTAAQWAAIQSGITAALVTKLTDLPTNAELNQRITQAIATALLNYYTKSEIDAALRNKQDVIQDLSAIRSGAQAGSTAYQKPQGGIPSTDMSQDVQTSLEKANTALQEHQSLDAYAKNDGYYEGMGVGTADNLTGQTERTDDAMYRKSGGSEEVASGTATIANIKGNTVAWNQLIDTGTTEVTPVNGRKICTVIDGVKSIITSDGSAIAVSGGTDMLFDLTLIYGIGNEPTTVAQFEEDYFKWFGKPLTYEAYDAGSLRSVQLDSLKTTGFNQWDEEWEVGLISKTGQNMFDSTHIRSKNYIPVIPNLSYYLQITSPNVLRVCGYNYNKNFVYFEQNLGRTSISIPSNVYYLRFCVFTDGYGTPYKNDICINISDTSRNGEYEPYEEHSVSLPVTTITGKLNGEGESVVVFPDGMKSAGSVYDEIYTVGDKTYAVQRVGSIDLGTIPFRHLYWYGESTFVSDVTSQSLGIAANNVNFKCPKYTRRGSFTDKFIIPYSQYNISQGNVVIRDTTYPDATTFRAAMNGVLLYYVLAAPEVYKLDTFDLPKPYQVDGNGTEEQIQKSDVQGLAAILTVLYGVDVVKILDKLPQNYIGEASMDNFLAQLNTVTGGTWTKTWNENTGEWDFSFAPNAQTDDTNTNETI